MQKRPHVNLLILLLAVIMIISLTANSALAEDETIYTHSIVYKVGGKIDISREIGDIQNTGAVMKQDISGYGELTKSEDVRAADHIITVNGKTDWTTAADAIQNLKVTTTIELCARPMSTAAHAYEDDVYDIQEGDIVSPYHPLVVAGFLEVTGLTSQTWGAAVATDRGESGSYHADFKTAYGPGPYEEDLSDIRKYSDDYRWWFDDGKKSGIDRGDYYVGNYFNIEQYAYTSGGELRRFIDMSSPFSTTLLKESMDIEGMAKTQEAYLLDNLEPGPKAIQLVWWEIYF
jgi:signal peptidase I